MATNWNSINNAKDLLSIPNTETGGMFWFAMVSMVGTVLAVVLSPFGVETAILTSAFICMILGILLVYAGLMAWEFLLIFIGIILITFLYITYSNRNDNT